MSLKIGLSQIAPVWFDRERTLAKVCGSIIEASELGCGLVAFGEALVPGYPFWFEYSGVTAFNASFHKEFYSKYADQSVCLENGHLDDVCTIARDNQIAVYLGIVERPPSRGESLFASLVFIDKSGQICSVHRKLMPTYDERLTWAIGDGNGLKVHELGEFTVGGLNCWENWMPLARTSLYAQGEDLHIAVWPGNRRNTEDITRFIAKESRSYVASVSGLMRRSDFPVGTLPLEPILANAPEFLADGGSCIAGPDGEWVAAPFCDEEKMIVATLDHDMVRRERQNFDPTGHYSRPDVFDLEVDRRRQSTARFRED
jgi:predicted amidohydrolase